MQSPQGDIDSAALGCVHVPQTTEGHKKKKPHTTGSLEERAL